ncbi:hypothetical protein KAU19_02345 [Candidatus Parcubacteria bacterium]|nr:hypothetical protein [Candidatus Parcubacteria bacterium]
MKKSNIIITIIAVLIILVFSYYLFLKPAFIPIKPISNVPCSSEYWEAINKSDVAICESVTNLEAESNYCRDNCIKKIAYKKGETELCELINPDAEYNLAKYNSPEALVPIKDFCYMHLAEKLDDVSLCNNVESDWAKANCPIQ